MLGVGPKVRYNRNNKKSGGGGGRSISISTSRNEYSLDMHINKINISVTMSHIDIHSDINYDR